MKYLLISIVVGAIAIATPLNRAISQVPESTFRIGALMPLTGEFAMPAAAFREGMEIATESINSRGGVAGKKIQLLIEDTQSNPKTISAAANKLINIDHINVAITTSYPETEIGGGLFQHAKIPSLALWDSSPQIDAMGEYIFAIGPWTPSDAEVSARFAFKSLKARKAVVISTVEHWSELVADLFEKEFESQGGEVLARFKQNPGDTDFRAILTKVRALNPDVIYAPLASDILPFHKQKQAGGFAVPVVSSGVITDDHIKESPESLEGVYQSQISDPQRPQTVELAKIYKDKFGRELSMTWYVATGYDAIRLYVHAIGNVGVDSIAIKNFLYTVKNFPGASQDIEISAGGSSPYFVKMFQIQNSRFQKIE